jgi:hypothetical protein
LHLWGPSDSDPLFCIQITKFSREKDEQLLILHSILTAAGEMCGMRLLAVLTEQPCPQVRSLWVQDMTPCARGIHGPVPPARMHKERFFVRARLTLRVSVVSRNKSLTELEKKCLP